MGQRVLWVFRLEEEHEEDALLMDILLNWSDMSTEKMPCQIVIFGAGVLSDCAISIVQ